MARHELAEIARQLVAPGKGILAADESTGTITRRLEAVGVESTEPNRRAWRRLLFTTPGVEERIAGVILFDETIHQAHDDGTPFPELLAARGILPGIKVDRGAKDMPLFPGEKVTEGLDGLGQRMMDYYELGARFAKWRAVIRIGRDGGRALPTRVCLMDNARVLARYAAQAQARQLVPIVEPEVLMDGDHDLARCEEVTRLALELVFTELRAHRVTLEGILLKPNMVVPGKKGPQVSDAEIATATMRCFRRAVPAAVPGIVFLSGGMTGQEACARLDAMNRLGPHPWTLSFSFGRALQQDAMQDWSGRDGEVEAAQRRFAMRARCSGAAAAGRYEQEMEREAAG